MIAPWGAGSEDLARWGTYVAVAQTAGAIMDTCTRLNEGFDTVAGTRSVDLTGTKVGVSISFFNGDK
ncbi:hypothetical protein B0T20DRAFT_508032 [Sordaria brevicollis]|uniref:Uncharacterized protein n=1 Tax=Sordaria brevicollis TaxID=83679 RepID=A0AAE0UAE8_SORBR|nr:hypothetical protein B0T20DRAFT_508032 [Sordaria brevicollis]